MSLEWEDVVTRQVEELCKMADKVFGKIDESLVLNAPLLSIGTDCADVDSDEETPI